MSGQQKGTAEDLVEKKMPGEAGKECYFWRLKSESQMTKMRECSRISTVWTKTTLSVECYKYAFLHLSLTLFLKIVNLECPSLVLSLYAIVCVFVCVIMSHRRTHEYHVTVGNVSYNCFRWKHKHFVFSKTTHLLQSWEPAARTDGHVDWHV